MVDEEGKPLHGAKMIIIFEPVGGEGLRFIRRRPGRIAVPPGQYDVSIRVEGFKEQHLPLMMEVDGRVDWSQLKLIRDNSAPR